MDNGLVIEDLVVGEGEGAKDYNKVVVNYTGTLEDGSIFDSSLNPGRDPFTFTLGVGSVIKGWDQGVKDMKVGGKRKLTIPPELGYGDRGAGNVIPPGATLIFEVELLEIEAYWSNRSYNQKVRGLDTCPVKYDKTESQLKAFWKEGFSVFRDNLLFYTNRSINSEYITKISEFIQNVLVWFL